MLSTFADSRAVSLLRMDPHLARRRLYPLATEDGRTQGDGDERKLRAKGGTFLRKIYRVPLGPVPFERPHLGEKWWSTS